MRLPLTLALTLMLLTARAQLHKLSPIVLGTSSPIHSNVLNEDRTINIYLPDGYKADDTTHYPVIYLLDGGVDEDFIHVVGIVQFDNFEWINRVPKSIVVGIVNTDRKRDMTYPTTIAADKKRYPTTGGSRHFMDFIEKEVQPYINTLYHTTSSKTLIGESLGGLFATEVLFERPALFDKYLIISPSLWWDNGSLLNRTAACLADTFHQKTSVYIAVGKEGLTPTDIPRVMEVDANVLYDKLKAGKNITATFDYLPQETHATIGHQAVFNGFRALWPGR